MSAPTLLHGALPEEGLAAGTVYCATCHKPKMRGSRCVSCGWGGEIEPDTFACMVAARDADAAAITASNARESAFFRARENDDARVAVSDCRPVYCMHCDKPACRRCETADTVYCGNCGTPGGLHDGDWHGVEGGERCHRAECRRCRTPIRAPDDCNCAGCAATRGLGSSLHEELRLDHPRDCGDACQP